MASSGYLQAAVLLLVVQLLCLGAADADQETGTVIPAESRPCVDCHAFEFMQRALQDLKKTAFNLDARTETLVLRAERRALCDCMPTNSLRWVHPRTLPPVITPQHTDNDPVLNLYSCTAIFILTYSHNRHFILLSLISLLSEALIWNHASEGMSLCCLIWDDFYTTDVLHCETHACEISFHRHRVWVSSHPSPMKHKLFFCTF